MDNPAVLTDVSSRWHPYPYAGNTAAEAMVQAKLDQAWRALQDELPALPSRILAGEVSTASVVDVLVDATMRVLRNPEGFVEGSAGIDDYRESWKTDPSSRSADMFFTRAELRRLSPSKSGAFTIRPGA